MNAGFGRHEIASVKCSLLRTVAVALVACVPGLLAGATLAVAAAGEPDLNSLEATRNRPLFSPTRRPPPLPSHPAPVAIEPVVPPPPPPRLQLSGVIIGSGKRVAIVVRLGDAKTLSVEIGSQIDGWTVAAILPRGITLRRDARDFMVELPEPGKP